MGWGSVPENLLDSVARVRASVVKPCPSGAGFYTDASDSVVTTWQPVSFNEWRVPAPPVTWTFEAQWDAVIFDVEWRKRDGAVARAQVEVRRYATNDFNEPITWGIRHNLFNTIAAFVKGCS